MKTKPYLITLLIISFFSFISCKNNTEKEEIKEKKQNCLTAKQLDSLNPILVEPSPVVEKLRLNGKVAYNPNAVVNYVSLVSGIISNTFVSLGDKVEKNQVLAEIKSVELNEMQTQVKQLQAKLKVAQKELESKENFYEDKISSERELIAAQSEKENIESELEKLQNNLQMYSSSKEKNVFQIKAPRSGYVVDNKLVAGMQIGAEGEPLFTISDMDEVWINMNVYATNLNFVKQGMPIDIKINSYPGKIFEGEISNISHVMDPDENVLKARVVLENKELLLKPGLQVEGIVKSETDLKMPRLSDKAVVYHNDKYYVVVIEDECNLYEREVELYSQDEHTMYIKNGLDPGKKIVSRNTLLEFEHIISSK